MTTKQLTAEQLRSNLGEYARSLTEQRDRAAARWVRNTTLRRGEKYRAEDEAVLNAYNLALTHLGIWTNGEFGQQEDPPLPEPLPVYPIYTTCPRCSHQRREFTTATREYRCLACSHISLEEFA